MLDVTLQIRITLSGPILTRSTAMGSLGVDAPMARLFGRPEGAFYLPSSLVQGRLSHSWKELHTLFPDHGFDKALGELLGQGTDDAGEVATSNFLPQRGKLAFTDFVHDTQKVGPEEQERLDHPTLGYRIRMDPERGAVDHGAIQVMESPFAAGELVAFTGEISYFAVDREQADSIEQVVEQGLRWTTSFGAMRTSGFGRLLKVKVSKNSTSLDEAPADGGSESTDDVIGIAVHPQSPFCVARRRVYPNLFESEVFLSGAVLKGALATTLNGILGRSGGIDGGLPAPWQELGENFHHIRFTHAFPANSGTGARPVQVPQSLVKNTHGHNDSEGAVYDVALCDAPGLIKGPQGANGALELRAPMFSIDWKDSCDVLESFGWDRLDRELRVRTAIDPAKRRAEEGMLFAYEMVIPEQRRWLGYVDLSRVPAGVRQKVRSQLHTLIGYNLRSVGKTGARASVEWNAKFNSVHQSNSDPFPGGLWVVTLQTACLLCNPLDLDETSGAPELFASYQGAWTDLSGSSLKLVRFFARQSLVGGYLARRFQHSKPYNPFLLTDAGSVFVLEATADAGTAKLCIEEWISTGLPLPKWARDLYGEDWRTCPLLPANGFGEVAVNLSCHQDNKPPEDIWYPI
jgi:hypothetical protein